MTHRTLLAEARARGLSVLHSLMVADLLQGADRIRTQRIAIQDARIAARAALLYLARGGEVPTLLAELRDPAVRRRRRQLMQEEIRRYGMHGAAVEGEEGLGPTTPLSTPSPLPRDPADRELQQAMESIGRGMTVIHELLSRPSDAAAPGVRDPPGYHGAGGRR
jgi:hypothetical protein